MLIKATRLRASAGSGALARHLMDGEDNEAVETVQGTITDLEDAVADARRFGRTYAVRHFIIAPQVEMQRDQFRKVVAMLGEEFGFNPSSCLIVQHAKARAVAGVAGQHWHVVLPETDPATGRVLSSRHDHARHEKIARQVELLLGHPIIAGAHDLAVLAALRAEGKIEMADQLAAHLGQGERPASAFTTPQHQAAKRAGIDLALVRENIRAAVIDMPSGTQLRERLTAHGLALAQGDKPGTWIVVGPDDQFLGAAHRLAGQRKADFHALMEKEHDHHSQPDPAERRPDDSRRHAGASAGHGDNSGIGAKHRLADAGGEHVRSGRDAGPVANHRAPRGADRPEPVSPSSALRSTGDSECLAASDRQRLTEAVRTAVAGVVAMSKSFTVLSSLQQAQQHLVAQEQQARERIAAAEAKATTGVSNQLYAARLYKEATEAKFTEVMKAYRSAQEREAAMPPPRRSVMDRLLGRQPDTNGTEAMQQEVAALHADLVAADHVASGAMGNLARVEKAEAADRVSRLGEMEMERRSAMEALGEILMAQRLLQIFPAIGHCGPIFVKWAGAKVERKRRRHGPRNPQARTIWGLPIDLG